MSSTKPIHDRRQLVIGLQLFTQAVFRFQCGLEVDLRLVERPPAAGASFRALVVQFLQSRRPLVLRFRPLDPVDELLSIATFARFACEQPPCRLLEKVGRLVSEPEEIRCLKPLRIDGFGQGEFQRQVLNRAVVAGRHNNGSSQRAAVPEVGRPALAADFDSSARNAWSPRSWSELLRWFDNEAATKSRSSVVLPVPGGPLTANMPSAFRRSFHAELMATCWPQTCARFEGQHPSGNRFVSKAPSDNLLQVLHLFAQLLDQHFHLDRDVGHLQGRRLRAQRVRFAQQLLD